MQPEVATQHDPLTFVEMVFLLLVAAIGAGEVGAVTWLMTRGLLAS